MRAIGIWRALECARRRVLADAGLPPPKPAPSGIGRRAVLRALAAAPALAAMPAPAAIRPGQRVAIIGGGIAGLTALHHLRRADVDAQVYEARRRLGGRMHTLKRAGRPVFERGGQLVNTDHADIRALCGALGIGLVDRKAERAETQVIADGAVLSHAQLAAGLAPIAERIDADSALLDSDYDRYAPRFDRLSIANYLDRHAALLRAPWVCRLLESTARTEYGAEPDHASALELIFNLPTVDGERVEILGASDERFLIDGGSGALIDALAAAHPGRIAPGKEVIRIERAGARLRLIFLDLTSIEADRVIVAVPASIARRIEYAVPIAADWRAFLDVMQLGRNEKRQILTAARPWTATLGAGGELWPTDPGTPALAWDGGVVTAGDRAPVWTVFLGGDQVAARPDLDRLLAACAPAVPGIREAYTGPIGLNDRDFTAWHTDPLTLGAYSNFPPGQLTRFGHLFWLEDEVNARAAASRILFAGEHLSDAFPGYMNGAAQTGRLAAAALLGRQLAPESIAA